MFRRTVGLLLLAVVILLGGLNLVNRGMSEVLGPDYPRMIEYHGDWAEGQLQVLGKDYSVPPQIIALMSNLSNWRLKLELFLEKVEDFVEKHGRQTQEIMRRLQEGRKSLFV